MSAQHWQKAGQLDLAHLLDATLPLRDVLHQTEGLDPDTWIAVTRAENETYLLTHAELLGFRRRLRERLGLAPSERLNISIDELLDQCGVTPAVWVESQDAPSVEAKELTDKRTYLSDQRMLVLGRTDTQTGRGQWMQYGAVYLAEAQLASLPPDYPVRDSGTPAVGELPDALGNDVPRNAGPDQAEAPGLLGGGPHQQDACPLGNDAQPTDAYINAVIEGYEGGPLDVGTQYPLDFSVDEEKNETPAAIAGVAANVAARPPGQAVELTVDLYGNGFDITPQRASLHLNEQGLSVDKAHFDITPLREGSRELTAMVTRDGNIVQKITMTLAVGSGEHAESTVVSIGRPVAEAGRLSPRTIGMHISPEGTGYSCTVYGATHKRVHLPITNDELATAIGLLRERLLDVVHMEGDGGAAVFQIGIDIPRAVAAKSLRVLAEAGRTLFRTIFFHDGAGEDCRALGRWLIAEANADGPGFIMQIVADKFPVPWAALYLDPNIAWNENDIDWQRFLGMKHVIEQLPMGDLSSNTQIMPAAQGLGVSLNINQDIHPNTVVTAQVQYWTNRAGGVPLIALRHSTSTGELVEYLNDTQAADQIIYFYCHANSVDLIGDGPEASTITMGDQDWITLGGLKNAAPPEITLAGAPLVFLNACESAELSPLFYNGFVPYFMRKGARGVIGSECKVPVLFAEAWATSFFDGFLDGTPLGELVLMRRRAFFLSHNNVLGLLYGVHCNTDTQILHNVA